ncbi:hypothetical protein [Mycobacterium sp. HUMS_1102779]|uniref:hypothetical protein n=1 Tax=Mycobacterium sp. HUMS_1102779 TaxID=3383487 RepID=UPI00389A64CE
MVSRDGEPVLVRGPLSGSLQMANKYEIRTTPIPAGHHGTNWLGYFNSQFTGQKAITGYHDGHKITIECWPDDEPRLIETVDAAIEHANERVQG